MACILVVEDDPDTARLLSRLIEQLGYSTAVARDGAAALDYIRTHHPDLTLLDLMMPGMTGFDVLAEVRRDSATRDLRIVLFSALDDSATRDRAFLLGADAMWVKGKFDFRTIQSNIERHLPPAPCPNVRHHDGDGHGEPGGGSLPIDTFRIGL